MDLNFSLIDLIESEEEGRELTEDFSPNLFKLSPYLDDDSLIQILKTKTSSMKIVSLNCQSLNAKIDQLVIYLQLLRNNSCAFDVICLQETWLSDDSDVSNVHLDGYRFVHQGRSCSMHGGVAFYVRDDLSFTTLSINSHSNIWDGLFLEIDLKNFEFSNNRKKIIIGNIYRPPRNLLSNFRAFNEEINEILTNFQRTNHEVALVGDFNLDLLKFRENQHINDFFETILSNGFIPKITLPTRLSANQGTLIDNIFLKMSSDFSETTTGVLLNNISDHLPCFISLDYLVTKPIQPKWVKMYTNDQVSLQSFRDEIADRCALDRFRIDVAVNPHDNYDKLHQIITSAINKHLPTRIVRHNKYKHRKSKWISFGILRSIKFRDNLYRQLKRMDPTGNDYAQCKTRLTTYNRILKQNIRLAKKVYYQTSFDKFKNDIKKTWDTIKDIVNRTPKKQDLPDCFYIHGEEISEPVRIAKEFNDYFINLGVTLAEKINPPPDKCFKDFLSNPTAKEFHFKPVSVAEVESAINDLKPKSSFGFDRLSNNLLKHVKHEISPCLCLLVNYTFHTGTFPDKLKCAKVTPIYKKDNENLLENYRPVSVLTSISKVFEKIMHRQLQDYMLKSNLLYKSQYGFLPGHSTELAALELVDHIITKMDNNEVPINIYLDLSKAFDTLNHEILLYKLNYYGIRGNSLALMKSYLQNRKQYVVYKEVNSQSKIVRTGVPQGSILGPLLFLIYMNDIIHSSACFRAVIYADDTTLNTTLNFNSRSKDSNRENILNSELENVSSWLKVNKLSLNLQKTKAMIFHTPQRKVIKPNLVIDSHNIMFVDEFNYLGIYFDKHLTWKKHTEIISNKISKTTGIFNRLKRYLPRIIMVTLYNTLVLPYFNYGILLWGWRSERLARLQKKLIRIINNSRYNAHTDPLFKQVKLLKVTDLSMLHELKFCYKLKHSLLPEYFTDFIPPRQSENHRYNTRNSNNYQLLRVKHAFAKNNIRHKVPHLLNNTDISIIDKINTHSLYGFSKFLKYRYIESYSSGCTLRNCYVCNSV